MAKRTVVLVHGAFVTRGRPRMWRRGIVASMLLGAVSGLRSQLGVASPSSRTPWRSGSPQPASHSEFRPVLTHRAVQLAASYGGAAGVIGARPALVDDAHGRSGLSQRLQR